MKMDLNQLMLFGLLLLLGFVGANLAARTHRIPGITGMIIVGLLAGPSVLGVVSHDMLESARVFVDIALGLILFQLGLQLGIRQFLGERMVWVTAVAECTVTFVLVFGALLLTGLPILQSGMAAAVAVSSSPAVLLMVVRELKASGVVTSLSLQLVAFNNVIAFLLYTLLLPFVHYQQQAGFFAALIDPLFQLGGSIIIGIVLGVVLVYLGRWLLPKGGESFSLVVAIVLLALGSSRALGITPLLPLLVMGLVVRNIDSPDHLREVEFGRGGEIFFLILFVFAGANLHISQLVDAALPAAAFVAARFVSKWTVPFAVMRFHNRLRKPSVAAGLTLLPMAGMAIGLVQSTQALYPDFTATLSAVVLGAVAILETVGPIATEYALKLAGEVDDSDSIQH